MRTRSMFVFVGAFACAGCASFQDQTNRAEPHGILVVANQTDVPSEAGRVKKLDGLPVKSGREYRVRPGAHEVTVQFVLTGVETSRPSVFGGGLPQPPAVADVSQSGKMSVSEKTAVWGNTTRHPECPDAQRGFRDQCDHGRGGLALRT